MATKPQRFVRNGIIATVAGGLILAAILSLVPQLRDFFVKAMLWAWRIVTWIWVALFANYSAPGWVFLILGSFALVGLALLCVILWFQTVMLRTWQHVGRISRRRNPTSAAQNPAGAGCRRGTSDYASLIRPTYSGCPPRSEPRAGPFDKLRASLSRG